MTPADFMIGTRVDPSRRDVFTFASKGVWNPPVSREMERLILRTRRSANGTGARANVSRRRRRVTKTRLLLVVLALAILLLAVGGWVVEAFKAVV